MSANFLFALIALLNVGLQNAEPTNSEDPSTAEVYRSWSNEDPIIFDGEFSALRGNDFALVTRVPQSSIYRWLFSLPMLIDTVEDLDFRYAETLNTVTEDGAISTAEQASLEAMEAEFSRRYEDELRNALAVARAADDDDARMILLAIDLDSAIRTAIDTTRFVTARQELRDEPSCQTPLPYARPFTRFARAVAADDHIEQLFVLSEFQNSLNCLSADQVVIYAVLIDAILWRFETRWSAMGHGDVIDPMDDGINGIRGIYNPLLMLDDMVKYRGLSRFHSWLMYHARTFEYASAATDLRLHLYEPLSGSIEIFAPSGDFPLQIAALLDPMNVGMGTCSFVEMRGAAAAGGVPACGRSIGCEASMAAGSSMTPIRRSDGNGNEVPDETPFGVATASLVPTNCAGAGGSNSGLGGLSAAGEDSGNNPIVGAFPGANGGTWLGCTTAAMMATGNPGSNLGACLIEAGSAPHDGGSQFGVSANGVLSTGGDGCANPLAQSNNNSQNKDDDGDNDPFGIAELTEEVKNEVTDYLDTTEGREEFRQAAIVAIEESRRQELDKKDISLRRRAQINEGYDGMLRKLDEEFDQAAEGAQKTVQAATAKYKPADVFGDTANNGGSPVITINTKFGNPNPQIAKEQVASTLAHEMFHAFMAYLGGNTRFFDETTTAADHKAIQNLEKPGTNYSRRFPDPYNDPVWQALYRSLFGAWVSSSSTNEEEGANSRSSSGAQIPGGPEGQPGMCGAHEEMMADILSCTSDGVDGNLPASATPEPGKPDPGLILPTKQQFDDNLGNIMTACMQAYGIGAPKFSSEGGITASLLNPANPQGCGAMLCGEGAYAANTGSQCVCTAPSGDILRPQGPFEICDNSDACFRPQQPPPPPGLGQGQEFEEPVVLDLEPGRIQNDGPVTDDPVLPPQNPIPGQSPQNQTGTP